MTFLQGLGGVLTGGLTTVIDEIVNAANGGNGNVFQDSVLQYLYLLDWLLHF